MLIAEGVVGLAVLAALSYTGYNYRLTKRYRGGSSGSAFGKLADADSKISTLKSAVNSKKSDVAEIHERLDDLHNQLG
jgi:hypothetical protein